MVKVPERGAVLYYIGGFPLFWAALGAIGLTGFEMFKDGVADYGNLMAELANPETSAERKAELESFTSFWTEVVTPNTENLTAVNGATQPMNYLGYIVGGLGIHAGAFAMGKISKAVVGR